MSFYASIAAMLWSSILNHSLISFWFNFTFFASKQDTFVCSIINKSHKNTCISPTNNIFEGLCIFGLIPIRGLEIFWVPTPHWFLLMLGWCPLWQVRTIGSNWKNSMSQIGIGFNSQTKNNNCFKELNFKSNCLFYLCAEPKLKLVSKHMFEEKKWQKMRLTSS